MRDGYIYFVQRGDNGPIKIGFSTGPRKRMLSLQTGSSESLRCLGVVRGSTSDEVDLHRKFACHRLGGEWFAATEEIVQYARAISLPLSSQDPADLVLPHDANQKWLMEQASLLTDADGSERTGLCQKAFRNIRRGESKISYKALEHWCRNDRQFAVAYSEYIGLVLPDSILGRVLSNAVTSCVAAEAETAAAYTRFANAAVRLKP